MRRHTLAAFLLLFFLVACAPFVDDPLPPQSPVTAEPSPLEEVPLERDEVMEIMNTLSVKEKIGQLIFAGYNPASPEQIEGLITDYQVGGIILFKRNFTTLTDMVAVTTELQRLNKVNPIPLFIGLDEEGGTVSRLPNGATKLPDARQLGVINDPALTLRAAQTVALELRALGVNVNFAPVLDVYSQGTDFLYHRSFGATPDLVAEQGIAFMQGLTQGNILAVGKHFPGHGATPVDSHARLPVIDADLTTVQQRELAPFRAAIAAGIPAVMVGHLAFPALDPSGLPASRSYPILTELLRKELQFEGLILTDDLEMGAYLGNSTWEEAIVQTVQAGVDMLIIAHNFDKQIAAVNALNQAVLSGEIPLAKLDAAVYRIIRSKLSLKLPDESLPVKEALSLVGGPQSLALLDEIMRRSVK